MEMANMQNGSERKAVNYGRDGQGHVDIEELKKKNMEKLMKGDGLSKESNNSGSFNIGKPATGETREFLKENFKDSLELIDGELQLASGLIEDIKIHADDDSRKELSIIAFGQKVTNIEDSLKNLQELYKMDEFPELFGKLKEELSMFDTIKANYLKIKFDFNQKDAA